MYDVITVGSSTVDAFAEVESELIKIKTAHHTDELIAYPSGAKILIKELEMLTGGGGTNTAVSFKRLGLKTGYLGKIGNDTNGKIILEMLKKEKIDFVGVKSKGRSGYSFIVDSLEGDRTILAYKGVNNELSFKEIKMNKIKTKWFYFSSMVEKSFETLEKLAEYAEENKIKIAFNPSNYLAEKGYHYLKEVLSRTNLLILNKDEAMLLVGRHKMPTLIAKLMDYGPAQVVITDGKKGAYTINKGKLYHVVANKIKVTETTGAGDAFASTFLASKLKKKNVEDSLKIALVNAESVITNKGAKNGLLSYRKLLAKMRKKAPKVKKKKV